MARKSCSACSTLIAPLPTMLETTDAGFLALDHASREALLAPTAIARTGAARFAACLAASIGDRLRP